MRITQSEIESLGWIYNTASKMTSAYTLKPHLKDGKHNYVLFHEHKRDIINILDGNRKTSNEVTQCCNSVNDIKQLMKSQNISYENS